MVLEAGCHVLLCSSPDPAATLMVLPSSAGYDHRYLGGCDTQHVHRPLPPPGVFTLAGHARLSPAANLVACPSQQEQQQEVSFILARLSCFSLLLWP